jgi:hypothetical protein
VWKGWKSAFVSFGATKTPLESVWVRIHRLGNCPQEGFCRMKKQAVKKAYLRKILFPGIIFLPVRNILR